LHVTPEFPAFSQGLSQDISFECGFGHDYSLQSTFCVRGTVFSKEKLPMHKTVPWILYERSIFMEGTKNLHYGQFRVE